MALCCVGFLALVAGQWQDRQPFQGVAVVGATALSETAIRRAVDSIARKAQRDVVYADVRALVERLPYVRSASVYTGGEHALTIDVRERTPVAHMVMADGGLRYVDAEGNVLPVPDQRVGFDVPLIRTVDGRACSPEQIRLVARAIEQAQQRLDEGLYHSVSEIVVNTASGALDMVADGVTWRLPGMIAERGGRLHRTFANMNVFWNQAAQRLPSANVVVDLTWNGQVIVRRVVPPTSLAMLTQS